MTKIITLYGNKQNNWEKEGLILNSLEYKGDGYWNSPIIQTGTGFRIIIDGDQTVSNATDNRDTRIIRRVHKLREVVVLPREDIEEASYVSASGKEEIKSFTEYTRIQQEGGEVFTNEKQEQSSLLDTIIGTYTICLANNNLLVSKGNIKTVESGTSSSDGLGVLYGSGGYLNQYGDYNREIVQSISLFLRIETRNIFETEDRSENKIENHSIQLDSGKHSDRSNSSGTLLQTSKSAGWALSGKNIDLVVENTTKKEENFSQNSSGVTGNFSGSGLNTNTYDFDVKVYAYQNGVKKEVNSDPFFAFPITNAININESTKSINLNTDGLYIVTDKLTSHILSRTYTTDNVDNNDNYVYTPIPSSSLINTPVSFVQKKENFGSYWEAKGIISSVTLDPNNYEESNIRARKVQNISINISKISNVKFDRFVEYFNSEAVIRTDNGSIFALDLQSLTNISYGKPSIPSYFALYYGLTTYSPFSPGFNFNNTQLNVIENKFYISHEPKNSRSKNGKGYVEIWELQESDSGKLNFMKVETIEGSIYSLKHPDCKILGTSYYPSKS